MPDSTSAQPILDAAEQAAVVGDIDAAEQLLRQAVRVQETHLGPHHPDLANTLNNLGVVCEKTGRLDEAESCYRRAYNIAAAAFDPDHPFVVTSRKNLADFCEAHGRTIEPPATAAAAPSASPPRPVAPSTFEPSTSEDARPAAKPRGFQITRSSPLTIAFVAVLVLAVVGAIVMRRPSRPEESPSPDLPPSAQAPIESVTQPDAPANVPPPWPRSPPCLQKKLLPRPWFLTNGRSRSPGRFRSWLGATDRRGGTGLPAVLNHGLAGLAMRTGRLFGGTGIARLLHAHQGGERDGCRTSLVSRRRSPAESPPERGGQLRPRLPHLQPPGRRRNRPLARRGQDNRWNAAS